MTRFVARFPLFAWVACCLAMTVFVFVVYDLSAERAAWVTFDAAGYPVWAIISGIAIAWLRNSTFWAWLVIVGVGSGWLWFHARKACVRPKPPKGGKIMNRPKMFWYSFLGILPAYGAYNGSQSPGDPWEGGLAGLIAGLILAAILFAITWGIRFVVQKIKARNLS